MPTVAERVVDGLRGAGVTHLFGVPGGGGNLDLIDAAGRAGLPFVLTGTETAAAIAALAQAEVTGRPGACLTTLGPGAASAVNGVACAWLERAPLIVFTDSHEPLFGHQRIDHRALFAPVTKWSAALSADTADDTIARAIAVACDPPAGPVHIDCPGDVMTRSVAAVARDSAKAIDTARRPAALNRPSFEFSGARRPLLVAGLGARRPADARAILELCERRNLPAMVTYKAKGVVPDAHPSFAGVFTNAAIEQPLIDKSDLLIGVGLDPVELIPKRWARRPPIVYCGASSVEDGHVPFAAQWIGAIPELLQEIEAALPSAGWRLDDVRQKVRDQQAGVRVASEGLSAHRVVEVAANRLASSTRVVVDAGAHMFPATMLWPAAAPGDLLISNGLSTMGFALPAAIGAALADRSRPITVLTGDGGLLMCAAELLTAARERLPIVVIVFADASLSLIEIKQQHKMYRPSGVALGAVSWPGLAGSLGAAAQCARNEGELDRAIAHAMETLEGPVLIEARVDRGNYGSTMKAIRG